MRRIIGVASASHEIIGHVSWIVAWGLISRSWSRSTHDSSTTCHFLWTVLATGTSSCKVALIHQFVGCGTNRSTVHRLIELRGKLLLRGRPRSHLHWSTVLIYDNLAVMFSVVLVSHTVVAWGCHQRLNEVLLLLKMPLWSLRIGLPLLLRLTIYHSHVILRKVEEAKSACLDLSTRVKKRHRIVWDRKAQQVLLLLLPLLLPFNPSQLTHIGTRLLIVQRYVNEVIFISNMLMLLIDLNGTSAIEKVIVCRLLLTLQEKSIKVLVLFDQLLLSACRLKLVWAYFQRHLLPILLLLLLLRIVWRVILCTRVHHGID